MIIEASLAAEVLTRAGYPTIPYGVGTPAVSGEPTDDKPVRLFESRIDVDAYEAFELVHPAYARQTLAVAAALPQTSGLRMIDIGTGPGLPLAMLRELRPDLLALAVEPSDVAVRYLKRRFAGDVAIDIRQASVTDLDPPGEPFPCAVSIGASHHLDTVAFLSSIRGQLDAAGRLIVADEMLSPFRTRDERHSTLIRHHLWYILDTLVVLPREAHAGDRQIAERIAADIPKASALAHTGKSAAAMHLLRRLFEELCQVDRPVQPSHQLAVFSRFHLLEIQALIAGLDYEVEQKTSPERFVALAQICGFELQDHRRIYATDGDRPFDSGTHLFVFETQ
jgi:SAM-dependent methyltransferase